MKENEKKTTLKSLNRSLEILDILSSSPYPMSVQDLSSRLSANRTTLYAALNTLCEKQFIEKNEHSGKYTIGHRLYEIGLNYKYKFPFTLAAETQAQIINKKYHLMVNLGIYKPVDTVLMLLSQMPSAESFSSHLIPQSYTMPAHTSAIGKIILSGLPDDKLAATLDQIEFRKFTKNSIMEKDTLFKALMEAREKGYATDAGEYFDTTYCIAAPIRDFENNIIAGISISNMSKQLYSEKFQEIADEIVSVGRQISMSIGWKPFL